jgi:hypothetical protein
LIVVVFPLILKGIRRGIGNRLGKKILLVEVREEHAPGRGGGVPPIGRLSPSELYVNPGLFLLFPPENQRPFLRWGPCLGSTFSTFPSVPCLRVFRGLDPLQSSQLTCQEVFPRLSFLLGRVTKVAITVEDDGREVIRGWVGCDVSQGGIEGAKQILSSGGIGLKALEKRCGDGEQLGVFTLSPIYQ